jgi:hypothetical protein
LFYYECLAGDGSSAQKSSGQKICSTPKSRLLDTVRADAKKMKLLEKTPKSHFEQMQALDQNDQLLELQLLDQNIEKCQQIEFKKVESLEHVRQFG